VPAFEAVLVEHGVLSPEDVAAMRKAILQETNEATDAAEAQPYPQASDLYTNVHEGAWQPWQS
jgi:TPP-dependent pyruvate/acetoin dehydrogenase alpha subunit